MGDMSTDLDNEDVTQTEQDNAFSFPELNRLHSFIRDLEDELECETTEQDMFKSVSFDDGHDSDGELESELRDIHHREDLNAERLMNDVPVTPIDDLYRGFTPHHTPHFGARTHSNLDIFLLALAEAGYADVDPGPIKTEPPSGFTTIANEFFDSALQNGEHSPIANPTLNADYDDLHTIAPSQQSQPTDGSPRKRHSLSIGIEHVTAESLRRNWDLDDDDENDDSGGSSSGGISPTSPYGTERRNNTVSKTNSSMQFPDLLSSPATPSQGKPFMSPSSDEGVGSGSGRGKMQVDPRLHGDFNVWSGGPMLSAEAIQREYLGLYPTALTHHIQDGRLLPCADLVERVAAMTSTRKQNGRSFYEGPFDVHEIPQGGSSSPFSPGWSQGNPSTRRLSNTHSSHTPSSVASRSMMSHTLPYYYNRHVMECVLRPDRELKHIMIDLMRFFFDRDEICHQLQANHLVVFPALKALSSSPSALPSSTTSTHRTATNANANANDESLYEDIVVSNDWDLLDIQVCLSRELKQHILLVQFLQRVPTGLVEATGFAVGSTGMVNSNGSFVGGSHGHVLICADVIPDSLPLRACLATRKLAVHLKKLLIAEHLTLSALYTVPIPEVCALPRGLDTHFVALLQSLTRELLWTRLRQEYRTMDEHVQEMESYTTQFAKLLEPIYKAYGMSIQDMVFKPSPLPPVGNPPPTKVGSSTATSTIRKRNSDAGGGGDGRHQRAGSVGAMAVGHRELQREEEAVRRATIAGMYTTAVEEDHLVAVRHPFPTGGDANSVASMASTRVLGGAAAEPPSPPVRSETVAHQALLPPTQSVTTPLPPPARPSALKSPRAAASQVDGQQGPLPPKTPTRSVTIRLDTNTFHEAVPPASSSPPPSSTNVVVDSTTTYSTPTRGSSFSFPETPLSALTESPASMVSPGNMGADDDASTGMTTPTRHHPTTDDASATGGGDESMSTVSLSSSSTRLNPSTTASIASFARKPKENPWMTGPVSPGTARVIMQADMSPASVKVRLQEQYANNSKVDGMVFCLIMRDKMFQEMQHSCDQEYAEKMCNRHNLTLLTVQDLTAHRKALLMAIVCHRNVQKASLMKTFHTTFTGVAVTRWVSAQQIAGTATILRQQPPSNAAVTTTTKPTTDSTTSTSISSTTATGKALPATKSFFSSFFGGSSSSASASTTDNTASTGGGRPPASSSSSSSSSSAVGTTAASSGTDGWIAISSSFPIHDEVVLYYFTFLGSGGQQGTIYLTMRYLCMVSSLMGFMNTKKEVFALADLTDYCVSTAGQEMAASGGATGSNSNSSNSNSHANGTNETATTGSTTMGATLLGAFRVLKLVLHQGQREIVVRPMLVDAAKVHQMIAEIFAHFKPAAASAAASLLPQEQQHQQQPQQSSMASAST